MDISSATEIDPAFLESEVLIINITCKDINAFNRLIELIQQSSVRYVLFISSSSVYRNLQREVSEDEQAENPDSMLFQIENLFRNNPHFQTTVIRMSGLIGPARHPGRFFRHGKTVKQALAPVNLIHLDDCLAIIQAIINQKAWGQVFNACADSHPIKRDFYSHSAHLLGRTAPEFADSADNAYKIVSNQKLKDMLGYQFIHPDLLQLNNNDYE